MATWKDGAAYAPVERPDGFATPVAEPLPAGPPYRAETPGPIAHPQGFEPLPPQQPLAEVGHQKASGRDPRDAFTVASSLLTAGPDGARSGPRDPRMPFPTAVQSPLDISPPPPTGPPLATDLSQFPPPVPAQQNRYAPPQQHPHLPAQQNPYMPAQQNPYVPAQQQPPSVDPSHRTLARVSGGLCLVGFFFTGTAAFMLLVAGLMGLRTRQLTKALGYMALGSGAAGVLMQFLLSSYEYSLFSGIWGLIALGCGVGFLVYSLKDRGGYSLKDR